MSTSWEELKTHVAMADSTQLSAEELVGLVWRAMQPSHFCWLAWMFAAQGEVVLWMHTLTSALRVLKQPDWVNSFVTSYFTDENAAACHRDVRPHWTTMHVAFQTQAAYRSPNVRQRDRALDAIPVNPGGGAALLPLSVQQAAMNPANHDRTNHR